MATIVQRLLPIVVVLFFLVLLSLFASVLCQENGGGGGKWDLLTRSIGISAMHIALLPNDKVIAFDRTDFGSSNISLPSGRCRNDPLDRALIHDCSAHSVEIDPFTRRIRPLTILTDTWCSSGGLSSAGVLVQTGGFNDGIRAVRYFKPCADGRCDWSEDSDGLAARRWYATNQVLEDGETFVVVGGRRQFNYEFVPKRLASERAVFDLPFLRETTDPVVENNLYPFVHLSTDGNLFIFANTKSILLDYINHRVVRSFPEMPGGDARNYPCTGSSVLLPLFDARDIAVDAEVMVCGGAPPEANLMANKSVFLPASNTCGRLRITEVSPEWKMETMPMGRVMGDMLLLPTGDVLIINGAGKGSAGWGVGREPVLSPVLYHTGAVYKDKRSGAFDVLSPSGIPRLYHSTAHLLSDGRVLVGGSNPNVRYEFTGVLFPTELSLETFSPPYVASASRPLITSVAPGKEMAYGQNVTVGFETKERVLEGDDVKITLVAPSFATHSFSMNQRLVVLEVEGVRQGNGGGYEVQGFAPGRAVLAPPGYYLLFVVHAGVPSMGVWVQIHQ